MLEVWFGPSWEILLDSELEPDSPGKPRLVTTDTGPEITEAGGVGHPP